MESVRLVNILTSLAVEAAEPLMVVLLILDTGPVQSEQGDVFGVLARPLRRRQVGCVTNGPEEERCHKHLQHQGQGDNKTQENNVSLLFISSCVYKIQN